MTLQALKDRVINLGITKQAKIEAYIDLKAELYAKVRQQVIYQSEADLRLENFKKEAESYLTNEYNAIVSKLEEVKQVELAKVKAEVKGVTADDVAELTLLATMPLSEQDIKDYLVRYQEKPLAIRKIHELAYNAGISLGSYTTKEEVLNSLIQMLSNHANYYNGVIVSDVEGKATDLSFALVVATDEINKEYDKFINYYDSPVGDLSRLGL